MVTTWFLANLFSGSNFFLLFQLYFWVLSALGCAACFVLTKIRWEDDSDLLRSNDFDDSGRGNVDLNGNWYPNGNRTMRCSIRQHRGNLTLQNEQGVRASGSFHGRYDVTTNWQGTINGTVSRDGNRINWDNGTYWIRYRLYTQ